MYGYSTLICLPDGLSSTPSAGTGTVMRRPILNDYATGAGFASVEVLPIEGFGFSGSIACAIDAASDASRVKRSSSGGFALA